MKKMNTLACLVFSSMVGMTTYVLLNKNTKQKADKLINTMLDKANDFTENMYEEDSY